MAVDIGGGSGTYRLLYFRPDPDDDERVCIALVLSGQGEHELLYDHKFSRLKCLSAGFDPDTLDYLLRDLIQTLRSRADHVVLKSYEPQISFSPARQVVWPPSAETKQRLLQRFVLRDKSQSAPESAPEKSMLLGRHFEAFVRQFAKNGDIVVRNRVSARQVLGRSPNRRMRRIALAVASDRLTILVDGVDFQVLSPSETIRRISSVAHVFWQYGQLRQQLSLDLPGISLRRVGLVLNELPPSRSVHKDAYDFALHEFKQESDLVVDSATGDGIDGFRSMLRG